VPIAFHSHAADGAVYRVGTHLPTMKSDGELISEYTQQRSEAAFRQLVERYGGTVYSILSKAVADAHLAEDAAQLVFSTLPRNPHGWSPDHRALAVSDGHLLPTPGK